MMAWPRRDDVRRVLRSIEELGEIGRDERGGTTRLAYTPPDVAARRWLAARMEAAGLQVETDAIGNVFGWLGRRAEKAPVLLGSHIDTVPGGGAYDGALGVIVAFETIRSLASEGWSPYRPVGVVSFACEEGSRFGMSSVGSRALIGQLTQDDLSRLHDRDGISLFDALAAAGLSPEGVTGLRRQPGWFRAYLEAHIDQGPDLDEIGCAVGIVRAIAGMFRYRLTFIGQEAHSGAAPMGRRRDAIAAAAEAILITETSALERREEVVATVGALEVVPGIINVIPGLVRIGLETRALSLDSAKRLEAALRERIDDHAAARQVAVEWEVLSQSSPTEMSSEVRGILCAACQATDAPAYEMVSWPGHDALHMAQHGPAGMLLVRNPAQISHHPAESVREGDLGVLLAVLRGTLLSLAEG